MKPNLTRPLRPGLRTNVYILLFLSVALTGTSVSSFAQTLRTSVQSGNWSNQNTWDCSCVPAVNDDVIISTNHTVTFVSNGNTVRNLTINSGGILSDNGNTNTITGNLKVNGTYSGNGVITLSGNGTTIDGTGSISNTAQVTVNGNKIILSTANLTKNSGNVLINGNYSITNNGTITLGGQITAASGSSGNGATWTNAANSTLNIGGSGNAILSGSSATRILNASAIGNTVNYYGSASQNIKGASSGTYYNLKISGASGATLTATTIVSGDLTISNSTFSASTFSLSVRGNWINSGTFNAGTSTVTVDGNVNQSFTSAFAETFYNLTVNKTSGTVFFNKSVSVTNILTMSSATGGAGNIDMGTNTLTLGTDLTALGTLTYSGSSSIVGKFERWLNAVGAYQFPIGVSSFGRPLLLNINSLTSGGSLIAEFSTGYPGNNGLPLTESSQTLYNTFRDGYWSLTTANSLSSSNYNLELTGNGFTGFPSITSETRLLTRANSSGNWTLNGTHGTNSGSTVKRNSLNILSAQYAFGDNTNCPAPATGNISGSASVCKNDLSQVYFVTDNPGNTYVWSVSGGTITSGQGTSSIVVDWGSTGMAGSVSVLESNSCTSGDVVVKTVNINPLAPVSITGRLNVPQNSTTPETYSTDQADFTAFEWTVIGGTFPVAEATSNTINVTWGAFGTGSICVKGINSCGESASLCYSVNIYRIIYSLKSGNWKNDNTWDCSCNPSDGDNITIKSTHSISVNSDIVNLKLSNLTIDPSGSLAVSKPLEVMGDLTVNGTLSGTSAITLSTLIVESTVIPTFIEGTGNITNTATLTISGNKTIPSNSSLSKTGSITVNTGVSLVNYGTLTLTGNFTLNQNVTLTNHGTITIPGNLTGGTSNSNTRIVNNEQNANLRVGGFLLLTSANVSTGLLNAFASGNSVSYTGASAQTVKTPETNQYANLSFTGAGDKTLPSATLAVNGNIYNESVVVPGSGVVNFNGTTAITGTAAPSFNDVIVSGTLTSYTGNMNIAGDFTHNGTFNHNNGTVVFNGTSGISDISGSSTLTTFNNLTANTSGGVRIQKAVELLGVLNVGAGVTFSANGTGAGTFTLRSTGESTANDASIGSLLNGASVSGNVKVERYMSSLPRIYRYLSSPVQNATLQQWANHFSITGNISGLKKTAICGYFVTPTSPSLFYYRESVAGPSVNGYMAYPSSTAQGLAAPITRGVGFAAYVRNCTSFVMNVLGPVNQGDIPFDSISYNDSGDAADGYNLIGNPYASAIDWASVTGWARSNIHQVAAVTNNHSESAQFIYMDATDLSPQVIASGQGFWVQATNGAASLTINETAKVVSATGSFYRDSNKEKDHLIIKLSNGRDTDNAYMKLRSFAKTEKDEYDGIKLKNGIFDVFTFSSDNYPMAINSTPLINCQEPLRVGIRNLKPGSYTLSLEALGRYGNLNFSLKDNYTNTTKILTDLSYEFTVSTDPASFKTERFTLYAEQKISSAPVALNYNAVSCDGSAAITIENPLKGIGYRFYTTTDSLLAEVIADSDTVKLSIPTSALSKGDNEFKVQSVLGCGGIGETAIASIHLSEKPTGITTIDGKSCGSGKIELGVTGIASTDHVSWFEKEADTEPFSNGPYVSTGIISKTATFYAEVTNEKGCISDRLPVTAEVIWVKEPMIQESEGSVLISDYESTTWYYNGEAVSTGKEITGTETGVYTAEVTVNGCSARTQYTLLILGSEESPSLSLTVYPNPFVTSISIPIGAQEVIQSVSLQDATGKRHELKQLKANDENSRTYDVSFATSGLYILKIDYTSKIRYVKLIKK
jgi:trimeric autotransporter adhesin